MNKADALINAIANQRNNALNECATLAAELAVAQARIKELEEEVKQKNDPTVTSPAE